MRKLFLFLLVLSTIVANAQGTEQVVFNERIRSLQVAPEGFPYAPPVIALGSNDRVLISFDHLAEDREYLRYELVHCNADWTPSPLVDTEFLDGFNQGVIDDYDFSRLTNTHYVNYRLAIPNGSVAPTRSGNYLLKIYPEDDPDDIWLQCRFYVSEQTAQVDAELSSRTDVDYNQSHQQLALRIDTERAAVEDPYNDITVVISQNGRTDNEAVIRHPLRMGSRSVAYYEHLPQLIFEAGNEYRRFETVSTHYPGMGVESITYREPWYVFTLYPDAMRSTEPYSYDQTQFGRFTIREYNSSQSDVEADYGIVFFALDMPELPDADIFIDGDMVGRRFSPESRMNYNRATGRYEKALLLKQGAYNYQYLAVPHGSMVGQTAPVEGNFYQTQNEYTIKVYTRRPTDRTDRLISVTTLSPR